MMDPQKVNLKFRQHPKGNQTIAYCEEYPTVQGIGPDQGHAIGNFWKAFNQAESKGEHQAALQRKEALKTQENLDLKGAKKKAA